MVPLFAKLKSFPKTFVCHNITLESRIIGGVGIIGGRGGGWGGVVDIEIIINNRGGGVGIIGGLDGVVKIVQAVS